MEDAYGLSPDAIHDYMAAVQKFGNRMGAHLAAKEFNPGEFLREREALAIEVQEKRYDDYVEKKSLLAMPK